MPLQCSWTGVVLEFAFGVEAVAASLPKIWRAGASHIGARFWCGAVRISTGLGFWNVLRAAPLCLSLPSWIQEQKLLRSGKMCAAYLLFYNTNTPAARLLLCEIFCLFSALNTWIWCLGSKIGLVTGCSKSCFQLFLTHSRGMSLKREGKKRPRSIFFCFIIFRRENIHTQLAHREAPVTSFQHISPEQPSPALPALSAKMKK